MCALHKGAVSVITLGRMGFMAAYDVQMRYARQHLDELSGKPYIHGENVLLLVEHDPVFTVGIKNRDITKSEEARLKKTGAEFFRTNRSGLITFQGPGQLVAYPVLNLHHFRPSMRWYVNQLEQTMISLLRQFGLTGRTTDQTGVWVGDRKIGCIGLHGSRYVTTHGVSLNCNVDLDWFKHIVPSGPNGEEMTSLSKELKRDVQYKDAVRPFLRCFQDAFDCELEFKMLDEKELKSCVSCPAPWGAEFEAGPGGKGTLQRAEHGLRHLSTLSLSTTPKGGGHSAKLTPMW